MIDLRLWMYRQLDPEIREQVLERDGNICRNCGIISLTSLHVHHIVPVRKGGSNDLDNLISLCASCHGKIEPKRKMGYPIKITKDLATIKVKEATYKELVARGRYRDTMDSILVRLLDEHGIK